jgi:hypothetical protein
MVAPAGRKATHVAPSWPPVQACIPTARAQQGAAWTQIGGADAQIDGMKPESMIFWGNQAMASVDSRHDETHIDEFGGDRSLG